MYEVLGILWKGLLEVLAELFSRPDVVVNDPDPELETLDPVSDADLLDRYGMLDQN